MEIDQLIFKKLHKFYQNLTTKFDEELEKKTVYLEPLKPRLTILSRALTGLQNEIITSDREGGWSGLKFYLPKSISFSDKKNSNINHYIFRVLYLSIQQKLNLNWKDNIEHKINFSQKEAQKVSNQILKELFHEYPATIEFYKSLKSDLEEYYRNKQIPCDYSWLYGRYMKLNQHEFNSKTDLPKANSKFEKQEITTELEANPSDEVAIIGIDKKQTEDSVVTNNFEKVETLSEFNGTFKEMDGDDTLSDDEDAIRELNLKHTIRADDISHSVYKAEFVNSKSNIIVDDNSENSYFLHYNEWDYKKSAYKKDFCKVFPQVLKKTNNNYIANTLKEGPKTLQELHRLFSRIHNKFEKVDKVNSGEEINFDAVTDAFIDIISKRTANEKLYTTKRKRKKDLALLILIDTSLSADSYTNNERIIDVEKKAVILFGEILSNYNISFQIDTFSSRTRNNCSYKTVKSFNEKWSTTKARIGAIETEGYTRIGTALRHAGYLINNESNKRKWIILLSDGKPNDYDTYEGTYGIEDVKQALRELNKNHVNTFALAIEAQAKYYLPQMFGHNNYNILPKPSELPLAFSKFYKRILND